MAESSANISAQNPWPWLDPFGEDARNFFHGRDDDTAALLRMVRGAPVTVLFGKSGLGKTSLLQAGLFRPLRDDHLLPIYVRLRYGPDSGSLQKQLWDAFAVACAANGITCVPPAEATVPLENEWFWLFLHQRPAGLRNANGIVMHPVFVLDQFEEHFTLGSADTSRQGRIFAELGDLLENRIPHSMAAMLAQNDAILDDHDLDTQAYKFLISLREDYLPDLELWCDEIPRLGPNRYRLMPMGRAQAMASITGTGGGLVTEAKAKQIVDYLTQKNNSPPPQRRGRKPADIQVEPALLSLVCAGLNAKRIETGAAQLDTDDLNRQGSEIIEQFYDDRLKPMPEAVHRLIERELITVDGIRLQYPVQSAIAQGSITQEQLDQLIGQRILRKESGGDAPRVELVHDRLAAVAFKRRREAELRESALEQQARLDEAQRLESARRKAQRYRRLAFAAATVLSIVVFLLYDAYRARGMAEEATAQAKGATAEAQRRRDEAVSAQKEAENALADVRRLHADNKAYEAAIQANPALAKSVANQESGKTLVYLQVPRTGDPSAAGRLHQQLQEKGYVSQPIEKVSVAPKEFELRYFRVSDQADAIKLGNLVKGWNHGDIHVKLVRGYENRSRLKQFEIWFPASEKSALARLVDEMDAPSDELRKQAIQQLWSKYRSSSEGIEQVLGLYQPERIGTLTPNGMINGVRYLCNTDPRAWNTSLEKIARDAIVAIEARKPGPNTLEQAKKLGELLDGLKLKTGK